MEREGGEGVPVRTSAKQGVAGERPSSCKFNLV